MFYIVVKPRSADVKGWQTPIMMYKNVVVASGNAARVHWEALGNMKLAQMEVERQENLWKLDLPATPTVGCQCSCHDAPEETVVMHFVSCCADSGKVYKLPELAPMQYESDIPSVLGGPPTTAGVECQCPCHSENYYNNIDVVRSCCSGKHPTVIGTV